jgi:hypothetical protein
MNTFSSIDFPGTDFQKAVEGSRQGSRTGVKLRTARCKTLACSSAQVSDLVKRRQHNNEPLDFIKGYEFPD